jgi:hypothetical protein
VKIDGSLKVKDADATAALSATRLALREKILT